eukprot:COSAG01_NODE_37171_length_507_cov_1.549020_1_plen_38_part_01
MCFCEKYGAAGSTCSRTVFQYVCAQGMITDHETGRSLT